jgi:hypothetical protein
VQSSSGRIFFFGFSLKAFQILFCLTLPIQFQINVAAVLGQNNMVATYYSMSQGRIYLPLDKANVPRVHIYQGTLIR